MEYLPDFAGLGVGALGVAFGLLQYYKNWKMTRGEVVLITQLQKEVERYIKQNTDLFKEVMNLQEKVREMNHQITALTSANDELRAKLGEVSDFMTNTSDRMSGYERSDQN